MNISKPQSEAFRSELYDYYAAHGRHELPWRLATDGAFDPYHIVVSELMLQQTQVARVIPKYVTFLQRFPDVQALASASLGDVLIAWQGLGYNRRAKFLWQLAGQVVESRGNFPDTLEGLIKLPGIGPNTAGAVLAYAFNQPAVFIETNVRTVYIHHFFDDRSDVTDKEIHNLVSQTVDTAQPRIFYWALMDYGTYLKQTVGNKSAQSKHHTKQSQFEGSRRQVRGAILRALSGRGYQLEELAAIINDARFEPVLQELTSEGFIGTTDGVYHLA